ncbi:MAG: hypothetical protein M1836_002210 [Candelina mexicana]|nr:MAG: hypothetical protein M1836_002210 [Candelina mexicana]
MASRLKPRAIRRGAPKGPWDPIHQAPKARVSLRSSRESGTEDMVAGSNIAIQRRGRTSTEILTRPKSGLVHIQEVYPTAPDRSEISKLGTASGSEPPQRVLRSSARLGLLTLGSAFDPLPVTKKEVTSWVRAKYRSLPSNPTPSDPTLLSSQKVLRSGRRLGLPPTPTSIGKRKREGEASSTATPSKWRLRTPKPKPILIECSICAESKYLPPDFPESDAFSNCTHELKACRHCIARHVIFELESKGTWDHVTCLECRAPLLQDEVQAVITRMSARHCTVIVKRKELETNPNFRSCLSASCSFGQIHRLGSKNNQIVTCTACKAKSCFQHKVPWHENYTCEAYSNTPEAAITRTNEDRIRKETKKCPGEGCIWRIEKDGGCNHVFCTRCQKLFNWSDVPFDEEV